MILPIFVYGSPVLRKIAREITPEEPGLKKVIDDMWETMYVSDGIGLAAPQVGLSVRLFVIDGTELKEDDPSLDGFKKVFINTKMLNEEGQEWAYKEGCLSIPNIKEDVMRKSTITLEYFDENFEKHTETFDGMKARIIQHEYDHLQGVMLVDRINPLRRRLLKGKLMAISKGKVDVTYKIKAPQY